MGGQFLDFMGGHSCYEGDIEFMGVPQSPPLGKTLLPSSHSLSIPFQCHGNQGAGAFSYFFGKRLLQPWNIRSSKNFFNHAFSTQFPSYGHAMPMFSDTKGSFELPIIFFRVLTWWSCVSRIKQRVSSRAVNCISHKLVPSQLEFSKLTDADDSCCLRLTSSANRYFVYAQLDCAED